MVGRRLGWRMDTNGSDRPGVIGGSSTKKAGAEPNAQRTACLPSQQPNVELDSWFPPTGALCWR